MNFLIIQNDEVPSTTEAPFDIIQIFTNDDLYALARFVQFSLDNYGNKDSLESRTASRMMHLLQQWENKTQ